LPALEVAFSVIFTPIIRAALQSRTTRFIEKFLRCNVDRRTRRSIGSALLSSLLTLEGSKMYKRILLAYDGSVEGRTALREGALLARQCGAEVFLLSVLIDPGTFMLTEVALAGASVQMENDFMDVLNEGVARLRALGFDPVAKLVRGEPAKEIGTFAKQIEADLIVVGHRRQSAFDRWWSGPKGAYLMDYTDCSLLVARNVVSDDDMKVALPASGQTRD
jgi:nucleotide-binding universal stress UspA family protein